MTKRRNASSSSVGSSAIAETENPQYESDNLNNVALQRCIKAWDRTFDLASINPDDDSLDCLGEDDTVFAREQGALAFRDAMPSWSATKTSAISSPAQHMPCSRTSSRWTSAASSSKQPKSAIPAAEIVLKTAPFTVQIGRCSGGFQ